MDHIWVAAYGPRKLPGLRFLKLQAAIFGRLLWMTLYLFSERLFLPAFIICFLDWNWSYPDREPGSGHACAGGRAPAEAGSYPRLSLWGGAQHLAEVLDEPGLAAQDNWSGGSRLCPQVWLEFIYVNSSFIKPWWKKETIKFNNVVI